MSHFAPAPMCFKTRDVTQSLPILPWFHITPRTSLYFFQGHTDFWGGNYFTQYGVVSGKSELLQEGYMTYEVTYEPYKRPDWYIR